MNTREQNGDFETFCKIVDRTILQFVDNVVTQLGEKAFTSCTLLTDVNLPAATSIGNSAFRNCSALAGIELPVATSVGDYAFADCHALTKAVLPSVTRILEYTFSTCKALTSIDLPVATSIANNAFNSCTELTSVILRTQSRIVSLPSSNAFIRADKAIIYVPDSLVDSYKSATNWSAYADRIKPLSELPAEEEET